jgi:hypothetical protein
MTNEDDIEQLLFEARAGYTPTPEEHWELSALIASLIVRGAPGSTATCGDPPSRQGTVDYITPLPVTPLRVFGPDGRFIVSFLQDGSWIDATGNQSSTHGFIEGSPEAIARMLLEHAGINPRGGKPHRRSVNRTVHSDKLPRMLTPQPTRTWRDGYAFASPPKRDSNTPASICLKSPDSRLILAAYDPNSCTYASSYGANARWGIESLRVQTMPEDALRSGHAASPSQIHDGDCLITFGSKQSGPNNQLEYDDEDHHGDLLWHPQEVVHVEPEGSGFVRVWLIVDHDVGNEHADPRDIGLRIDRDQEKTRVLTGNERQEVIDAFSLDVFCTQCGNRARPIVYGLPGSSDPSYLIFGGCIMEPGQPDYACTCGHQWSNDRGGL